jgi:hypothetical protein
MSGENGLVVLIHGLWMNGTELTMLRWRLHEAGFATERFHYPTVRKSVADNAQAFADFLAARPERPLYVVAHSLGGLVTLNAFARRPDLPVARVVFMGAPARGSSVAREFAQHPVGETLLGEAGREGLAALHDPQWTYAPPLGVIAGTQSIGLGQLVTPFDGPNDGTVAVAETVISGAADSITLDAGHMTMLVSRAVAAQVIHFLRHGAFSR